jgi:hypothetical protein
MQGLGVVVLLLLGLLTCCVLQAWLLLAVVMVVDGKMGLGGCEPAQAWASNCTVPCALLPVLLLASCALDITWQGSTAIGSRHAI